MNPVIVAVISVSSIGAISAIILSFVSKFMFVKTDERLEEVSNLLPGVNCGACGHPGCAGYAQELITDENAKIN